MVLEVSGLGDLLELGLWVGGRNVLCYCFGLVVWNGVDVAEATAGGVCD